MLALSGTMLVGCTQSEYIGEAPQQNGKIVFSPTSGKMTRATSNTGVSVAEKLDGQIKFYGVKKTGETYSTVFKDYVLWSENAKTTSNYDGDWEYVGSNQPYGGLNGGSDTKGTTGYQDIKYWDYSASEYNFVAGSPVKAFTYNVKDNQIVSATVTDIAGHLNPNTGEGITTNPIYVAVPLRVKEEGYKKDVTFSFIRQQSYVRVGLFETIRGYDITDIKFYSYDAEKETWVNPTPNITLASKTKNYFTGAKNATATITYKWLGTPSYEFAYIGGDMQQQNNWFGGKLDKGVPAKTSTEGVIATLYGTDNDMDKNNGNFTVIPTTSNVEAAALLIKCDYVLTSKDGSGETITVTGATAAIPAAYAKWAPNTSYTYLFKISDNTNGTTGVEGTDPEGLFPITFDAAVVEVADGTAQGTVTTVSTPSITTYQEGFAAAMKYVANKPIYVTAQNNKDNEMMDLTGKVKVFKLGSKQTEADLILTAPTEGEIHFTCGNGEAVGAVVYKAGKYGSFKPTASGYYAIQYKNGDAAYAYKVVYVAD